MQSAKMNHEAKYDVIKIWFYNVICERSSKNKFE